MQGHDLLLTEKGESWMRLTDSKKSWKKHHSCDTNKRVRGNLLFASSIGFKVILKPRKEILQYYIGCRTYLFEEHNVALSGIYKGYH